MKWRLQDAKTRLAEVIKRAEDEGAQIVTVRGRDTAVVLSVRDYAGPATRHEDFVDHLLEEPPVPDAVAALIDERSRDLPRELDL